MILIELNGFCLTQGERNFGSFCRFFACKTLPLGSGHYVYVMGEWGLFPNVKNKS